MRCSPPLLLFQALMSYDWTSNTWDSLGHMRDGSRDTHDDDAQADANDSVA